MAGFLSDRKNCIAFLVIGWLVRGMVYHFFPLFNDILLWITVLWTLWILLDSVIRKRLKPDGMTILLAGFIAVITISTVINLDSIRAWGVIEVSDVWFSIAEAVMLVGIMFASAKYEAPDSYRLFLNRLFTAVFGYVCLLAAASVLLFVFYRMDIRLPGGFGGADQIFTYGHLGEETRFCGLFGYSTDGGNLCALAAALGVYLFEQKKLPLPVLLISLVLFAGTIVLLDVRTSMLALLLMAFVYGGHLLSRKTGGRKAFGIIAALVVLLVIAAVVLKRDTIIYYAGMVQEDPRQTLGFLTTGRSKYWELAVQGWLTKPVFGYGWMNNSFTGGFFDCHNLFFNLILWSGTAGTGLFLAFTVLWLRRLVKNRRKISAGMVLILLAVFVQSMLDRAIMGSANAGVETMCFWLTAGFAAYSAAQLKSIPEDA